MGVDALICAPPELLPMVKMDVAAGIDRVRCRQ